MEYYRVSKPGYTPSDFAINKKSVFAFNRELGGAFEHPKTPVDIYRFFMDMIAEGFKVEKVTDTNFKSIHKWFCAGDLTAYINALEDE